MEIEISKKRIFAFIIDLLLVKTIIFLLFKFLNLNNNLRDFYFLITYISYYMIATFFFKKTIGKKLFGLTIVFDKSKCIFPFSIIIKTILMLPMFLLFTNYQWKIKLGYGTYRSINSLIPLMFYYVYFMITRSFLPDCLSKLEVVKEDNNLLNHE